MNRLFFIAFILISVLTSLTKCTEQQSSIETVDNLETVEPVFDEITDRLIEVQKCAKCHQEEYESWLAGPHANAYKSLVQHLDHVKQSGNFPASYVNFLPSVFDNICMGCHTGSNLYETVFKGLDKEDNLDRIDSEHYPHYMTYALPRKGDVQLNLSTGVDCLTCHVSGKNVVTNGRTTTKKGDDESCSLVKSKFFSTNMNCYSCHYTQVNSMNRLLKEGKLEKELNCVECHQAYDSHGEPTHYYYWRQDHDSIDRPDKMNAFSDIKFELKPDNQLILSWQNSYIPHDFSECGEAVLKVTIFNSKGEKIESFQEHLNMKSHLSKQKPEHFQHGEMGHTFKYKAAPIERKMRFNSSLRNGTILIEGWVKPQYWSNEQELKLVTKEVFNL